MDSSHSDLQAFLVQDMATQGCTPTPSRGNQARISALKRALRAAYIPVAGARTELAIRPHGDGSTRALIRGSGSTTRRSRALPKVAPEGVRGIDTFFAPAPRGGADSRERGGEPVEPVLQPAQPVAEDDAAILRRCWKAVPPPLEGSEDHGRAWSLVTWNVHGLKRATHPIKRLTELHTLTRMCKPTVLFLQETWTQRGDSRGKPGALQAY